MTWKKGTYEKQTWDLRSFEKMDRSQEGDDDKIYTIWIQRLKQGCRWNKQIRTRWMQLNITRQTKIERESNDQYIKKISSPTWQFDDHKRLSTLEIALCAFKNKNEHKYKCLNLENKQEQIRRMKRKKTQPTAQEKPSKLKKSQIYKFTKL